MRRIERLYLKAAKAKLLNVKSLCLAFVSEKEDGSFEARGMLWDGRIGSMTDDDEIVSLHDTQEQAIEAIYRLAEQYPNREDVRIIIEDYGDLE